LISESSAGQSIGKALHAIWTFPSIVFSSFVLAWAAESAQFLVSQALALAILAWLQTLPEFAVEAVIAWERNVPLITANFTGSLRLLVGVGWPLIYITAAVSARRKQRARLAGHAPDGSSGETSRGSEEPGKSPGGVFRPAERESFFRTIYLDQEHAIEIMGLIPPLVYFWVIYLKGTLNMIDSVVLIAMYVSYLMVLRKVPPQEPEKLHELARIPRGILSMTRVRRNLIITLLFIGGGTALFLIAKPFLHSMLGVAVSLGVSQFIFVQWVAPFLSEFPEKVSAFYWARTVKRAPMGLMNMVSSNINQWTLLVGMIPVVFSISSGGYAAVVFDEHQKTEILLTMAQSILGFVLLANMKFRAHEALGLFGLWLIQFARPELREEMTLVYFGWAALECILAAAGKKRLVAFRDFANLWVQHSLSRGLLGRFGR
jgi:cation:H+ antiporter